MPEQSSFPPRQQTPSRLLEYLPAVFHGNSSHLEAESFLGQFLLPFEEVLFGKGQPSEPGLESEIAMLVNHLTPGKMREDFLSWFSQWIGFTLGAELSVPKQRAFLSDTMLYFGRRGTKENLEQLLHLFTEGDATVVEHDVAEFQIGVRSSLGIDSFLEGGPPHLFKVSLTMPSSYTQQASQSFASEADLRSFVGRVIEWDKPAHTAYELTVLCNKND